MAKQQDPNSLGAMMAAQNELASLNAGRLQNSQAEQAFLQQQQAANAVMMQAAQIGASGGVGQQVGAMNPQTQAILAQYGITGAPAMPGKTTSTSKTTQSGGNVKIENNTTTNNDVKIINPGGGGGNAEAGNQAKFQAWLSNAFAKQGQEYEVQRRAFSRRDRDLEKQSNKMMRALEKSTNGLSEKLNPENWQKAQGNQMKTFMTILLLSLAPILIKPIEEIFTKVKSFFGGNEGEGETIGQALSKSMGIDKNKGDTVLTGLKNIISDLKDGLIEYFNLLIDERSEAIKLVIDNKDLDWKQKLTGVLQAGFTGLKGASKTITSDIRKEAKEKLNTGLLGVDLEGNARGAFITGETAGTGIRSENFNVLGQLKNSPEASFSASSRVTSLMNSSDGKLHTAEISEAMSLLRQSAHRHGEICLGNEGQAKQFFQSWGISNYWDSFVDDKELMIKRDYTIVSYTETKDPSFARNYGIAGGSGYSEDKRSVLVEKGKENTVANVDLTQEEIYIPVVLYFLTKNGFKKVEEIIGGKGFKFDSSSDSIVMEKNRQRQEALGNYSATDINQSEYSSVLAIQQAAESYKEQRDNVDWGTAGDTLKTLTEKVIDPTTDRIGQLAKQGAFVFKSRVLGENGKYEKTKEGNQKFISDLTQTYAEELYKYYKSLGYSDNDAREQTARMAGFLTIQDALESDYGTNQNSPYFNYGNMITSDNRVPHRTGSDYDANGNKIKQWFRTFNSMEDYVKTKINLLKGDGKRNSQYKGSLEAKSLEEFLNLLQRGYDGKGGAGKYAEDVNYVKNIMTSSKDTLPMVENAVKEFTVETSQAENSAETSNYGTYYAEIHGHRVYMDKAKIMSGKTPYEAMTAVTKIDEKGIERAISLDEIKNGERDYNSFKDILNLRLSDSNPELYVVMPDNPPGIHLGFIKKRDMSKRTKETIKKMIDLGLIKGEDPYSLEVRISTHMTGKTFQVFILPSLWTHKLDSDRRPIFTGIVYQSAEEFPPIYDLITLADKAVDNNSCPIGTNPLFYYCAGIKSLPKEMTDTLNRLKKIVDTGKFSDKSELMYTYVNEKGNGFTKYANKTDLNLLRDLGLITSSEDSKPLWTGFAEEWRLPKGQISPSVQSGRVYSPETVLNSPYLTEINKSEDGKVAAGASAAMMGMATMVDGLLGTDFSKKLFPYSAGLETYSNASNNSNQESGGNNVVYRSGDNNAVDNSQTVFHVYGSWGNEASKATGES